MEEEQLALPHKSKYLREKTEEELPTSVQITVYDSGKTHINWIFFFMPCIKDFENNIIKRQCIFIKVHPTNLESYYELSIAKKVIYTEKIDYDTIMNETDNINSNVTKVLKENIEKILLHEKYIEEKIAELEQKQNYKVLAEYYYRRNKKRYFHFVKKLAQHNKRYKRELCKLYYDKENIALSSKIELQLGKCLIDS